MKNKSLLTPQDIKNFIMETISKLDFRETGCYLLSEIARKLNMNRRRLMWYEVKYDWKPEYILGKRRFYNLEKIVKFLDEHNVDYEYQHNLKLPTRIKNKISKKDRGLK